MVRAPCCEKMGLKKGPWTREEDRTLVDHVTLYGHGNWRALPKQAGLLRCGKSCRLRWTNYLRPDIKRGNFTKDEEETIINLHGSLGNRWSAIAARLPGRTDNEIKNVWHTHLKKRLKQIQVTPETKQDSTETFKSEQDIEEEPKPVDFMTESRFDDEGDHQNSPQHSSSYVSSVTTTTTSDDNNTSFHADILDNLLEIDENFWSDVFSEENSGATSSFPAVNDDHQHQILFSPLHGVENVYGYDSNVHDGMDFWYDLFTTAGELPELPEF